MANFRETVKSGLSETELARLKTAFDVIGDIAILEIDEELRVKEKFIAETLLNCHKNIKTVLRKDSAHEGEFRTQKFVYLAGEDKKVTVHKENDTRLRLNVEDVYFSPRMATERKRICGQVKNGENILVLFSGCGPYPCVIGRNTEARQVVGVEINPEGHRYAVENVRLNKLKNTFVFQGDAREVMEGFRKRKIGLKAHDTQIKSKIKDKVPILELHMFPEDMNRLDEIEVAVKDLGMEIVIHPPFYWNGMPSSLSSKDKKVAANMLKMQEMIKNMCARHGWRYIMHPHTRTSLDEKIDVSEEQLVKNLKKCRDKLMLLENMPYPEMDTSVVCRAAETAKVNICIDLAHAYITRKNDEDFYYSLMNLPKAYYHISDSNIYRYHFKGPHSLPIGEGDIDFKRVVPFICEGVIEVPSKDEKVGREMIESYHKYTKMMKDFLDFDRILMPMPMGGEDFLDVALDAAKKGTIIHFYDFLHEDDFDLAKDKIDKACKKAGRQYKILNLVKCGQFSPRTHRICVDFQLL